MFPINIASTQPKALISINLHDSSQLNQDSGPSEVWQLGATGKKAISQYVTINSNSNCEIITKKWIVFSFSMKKMYSISLHHHYSQFLAYLWSNGWYNFPQWVSLLEDSSFSSSPLCWDSLGLCCCSNHFQRSKHERMLKKTKTKVGRPVMWGVYTSSNAGGLTQCQPIPWRASILWDGLYFSTKTIPFNVGVNYPNW